MNKKLQNSLNKLLKATAQVTPRISCGCDRINAIEFAKNQCEAIEANGSRYVWTEKYDSTNCGDHCFGTCKFTGTCKHPNHPLPGGGGSYVQRMITPCTRHFKPRK